MRTVKPGIRLKPNGKFLATKSIDGKRYYAEKNTLREAENWKNKFHPLVAPSPVQDRISPTSSANEFLNGRDAMITVREVYEKYLRGPLKKFGTYSQYKIPKRMERFLPPIFSIRMAQLSPEVISELLTHAELNASKTYGRMNFHEELKYLKAMLNWYKAEIDFTFSVPVTKHHYRNSVISQPETGRKHLSLEEVVAFIDKLPFELQPMAEIQFTFALRIAEVCALTIETVDFKRKRIYIRQAMTWLKDIPKLKPTTKTGDEAELQMTAESESILRRVDAKRPSGCRYFFHHNGGMPRYRPIVEAYNKALKEAGINDVTGTHFLRHSAATLSRKYGGIDAAQAMLRHKSSVMAEHYAKLDFNEKASEVVIHAERAFIEARRATNATKVKIKTENLNYANEL
jgi:integrase